MDEYEDRCEPQGTIVATTEVDIPIDTRWMMNQIVKQVSERLYDDLKDGATKTVLAKLDERANVELEALFDRKITPTNKYGSPVGDETTIGDLLLREAEVWLKEVVNSRGERSRDSYSENSPRINWLFREALLAKDRHGSMKKGPLYDLVLKAIRDQIGDIEQTVKDEVQAQFAASLKAAVGGSRR